VKKLLSAILIFIFLAGGTSSSLGRTEHSKSKKHASKKHSKKGKKGKKSKSKEDKAELETQIGDADVKFNSGAGK